MQKTQCNDGNNPFIFAIFKVMIKHSVNVFENITIEEKFSTSFPRYFIPFSSLKFYILYV